MPCRGKVGLAMNCFQYAYVTNDFDRAVAASRHVHAMGPFKEMRDHSFPTGPGRQAIAHVALAFKDGLQFEIIQPLAEDVKVFTDFLTDTAFTIRFHHLGHFLPTAGEFRSQLAEARKAWPVPVDSSGFGGLYAYVDARDGLGHYLELLHFPDGSEMFDLPRY